MSLYGGVKTLLSDISITNRSFLSVFKRKKHISELKKRPDEDVALGCGKKDKVKKLSMFFLLDA